MAAESRTPSPISSIQDSHRPSDDSHESLGYQKTRRKTYSLATSVSGVYDAGVAASEAVGVPGESNGLLSGMEMSSDPLANTAADLSMTSIALADDDRTKTVDTTRILQRALVPNQKWDAGLDAFTDFPPRGVRHADYNKYVDELPDDAAAYTQVLIWCLARRIEHLKKAAPEQLRLSLLLVNVLQTLQHRLRGRLAALSTTAREPLRLQPKMANPTNEWYGVVHGRLQTAYDKIHETTRESYKLAGEFERLGLVAEAAGAGVAGAGATAPHDAAEDLLAVRRSDALNTSAELVESATRLDGLAMQTREAIYDEVERRDRLRILEIEDPIAVLRATEFQEEY